MIKKTNDNINSIRYYKRMKNYFATGIYQQKQAFDLVDLLQEIELIKKSDKHGQAWSKEHYKYGYTSYSSLDKLHKFSSTFSLLEKKIDKHVAKFLKELHYQAQVSKNLHMTNCWVNVMPARAQHSAHIHPLSVLSGTYYVATPPKASAIKFEDPRLGLFMNAPAVQPKAPTAKARFVSLQPKPGELILFESWLKHEVPSNSSASPRISISFNYGWV